MAFDSIGTEFRVNTFTNSTQSIFPESPQSIAMDDTGDFVVTWSSSGQDGSSNGIYAQRYNAAGVAQGSEFRVNTTTSNQQLFSTVAMDDTGDFVVTWSSLGQDGSGWEIYAQRYNAAGESVGSEFQVNTTTSNNQMYSTVAMDDTGDFVVTWTSYGQDGSRDGIYAQRYNAAGVAQGSEFRVNTTTNSTQWLSTVAMDDTGDFVVTWSSSGQDGSNSGVYAQRYNAAGESVGGEFLVNTTTSNNQMYSTVAMDNTGAFVVTWSSDSQDGSGWGVYSQRYNATGERVGGEFRVNTTTSNNQLYSTVAMDDTGDFVVTWTSYGQDGSRDGIYAQRYNATGEPVGGEFQVNTTSSNNQRVSAVAMDATGDFAVAWTGYQSGNGDIYAQRFGQVNQSPTTSNISNITVTEDSPNTVINLFAAFADSEDSDAQLTYTISNNSNPGLFSATPIDRLTGELTLNYATNANGTSNVTVRATDTGGLFVETTFGVNVTAVNDTPTLANAIADQAATEGSPFNFQFAANTFNDVDGDALSYTATLANGEPLPTWLTFDAATRTFSGAPSQANVGTLNLKVTASDATESVSDSFILEVVANNNNAPTVANPIGNKTAAEDAAFNFTFAANTFNDPDADTLSYTAKLANNDPLPSWLTFNAATRTFSGTPAQTDVGNLNVTVTATDPDGAIVSDIFALNVTNTNDAPTLANAIANQTAAAGTAFDFTFANNTFRDVDGDTLTYSAKLASSASLPAWLIFDSATRTFSGTPSQSNVGTISLEVTATDPDGATSSDIFALEVTNTNDAPTLSNNSTLTLNERGTATISNTLLQVTDADNTAAEITYKVTDSPDFGALKLDGVALNANSTFTQADINANKLTYTNNPVETASDNFTFTVSDGAGGNIGSTVFNIGVNAVNEVINGTAGNDALNGLRGNDTINGLAGNDLLNGGTGNDLLSGGAGNDTYIVNTTTDRISEAVNAGVDVVQSSATFTLSANVEKLTLTGTSAINGTGSSSSNTLEGNSANNVLDGVSGNDTLLGNAGNDTLVGGLGDDLLTGGIGADRLTGGTGKDRFVFTAKTQGKDTITDFSLIDDTINVSKLGFGGGLTANAAITVAQFRIGSAAGDSSDRFIYNKANGALLFDADGTGASAQVQFAQLSTGLAMTNNDIFVIA